MSTHFDTDIYIYVLNTFEYTVLCMDAMWHRNIDLVAVSLHIPALMHPGPFPMSQALKRGRVKMKTICCSGFSRILAKMWQKFDDSKHHNQDLANLRGVYKQKTQSPVFIPPTQ